MKNKLFKTVTYAMLVTTGVGFIAPLAQPLSVFAEEKTEVKSESLDLTKAIDDAKAAGVSVKMGETKLFQSREELDAYVKDTIAKLKDASSKAAELKKAHSQEDEAYNKAMTKYNQEKAEYDKKLAEYNKSIEDLKSMVTKEGYLSEPVGQSLIFNGEPDATVSISGQDAVVNHKKFYDEVSATKDVNLSMSPKKWLGDDRKDSIKPNSNNIIIMGKNKPVTVTYTNLKNSSYAGKKISKIVYEYTLLNSTTPEVIAEIYRDPAVTIHFASDDRKNAIEFGMKVSFYDDKGSKIEFTKENPALVSFASMNAENKPNVNIFYNEYVKDLKNLKFIKITGSSVVEKDGVIKSITDNNKEWKDKTSKYYGWDDAKSPVAWYGAGAALVTGSDVEFKFGANRDEWQWFSFNAAVKAKSVIQKPIAPTAPAPVKSSGQDISIDVSDARMVITKHIDITTGKEISKQEDGKQPKKDIPGYEFVETKDEGGNTIHYYKLVEKPAEKVITKHIDITTGKEISKQEDGKQPKKDIPGYEFVETKDEGGNTIHYYKPVEKPAEKVITKHIDITTGKEISKQEDGKQPKKDIPGYEFVETKDEGGNTIHYYKPVEKPAEKVITKHIDITTGKEISKQEDGKQPKKDIPGYEFVETKDEGGNTIHYYKPVEKKETPKELPKTSEQAKQRNTAIIALLSVVGLGGLATYLGLRKRNEN